MTELEQAVEVLAKKKEADEARRASIELDQRTREKRELLAGRLTPVCSCLFCLDRIIKLLPRDKVGCARSRGGIPQ
jgi:hypothetical protein